MRKLLFISLILCGGACSGQVAMASFAGMNNDSNWFEYQKADFNSNQSDFGMTANGNGYVFVSSRSSNYAVRYFSTDAQNPLLDLYFVEQNGDDFTGPVPFSSAINSPANNEGPLTFSRDGQLLIFTANDKQSKKLVLFQCSRQKNSWSKPQLMSFCTDGATYMHPCFASGDSVLYFCSDRNGGSGGTDIYYVRRINGAWSQPVNVGRKVNSPYDEKFPFCSAQDILYFSSNRHGGNGGLDIYVTGIADSSVSPVYALSSPFNSAADDFGFSISEDNHQGFFSSNRGNEKTDDDIYLFRYRWPDAARMDTLVPVQLCYEFFEESTVRTGDTAKMKYTWRFSDGDLRYGYVFEKCFDTTGVYDIVLTVRDSSGGDVVISETEFGFVIDQPNYIDVQCPDTVRAGKSFALSTARSEVQGFDIITVCYDMGGGACGTGRSIEHTYHHAGTYCSRIYLLLKNKDTGATESRCVVKKLIVI